VRVSKMNLEEQDDNGNPRSADDLCGDFSQYVLVDIDARKDEDSEGDDDSSLSSNSYISTAGDQVDHDEASQYTYEDSECSDADHLFADVEDEATVVTLQSAAATIAKLERKEKELKDKAIVDSMTLEQRLELARAAVETGNLDVSDHEQKIAVLKFMKLTGITDQITAEKHLSATGYEIDKAMDSLRKGSRGDLLNMFLSATGLAVTDSIHVKIAEAYLNRFDWSGSKLEAAVNLYLDAKQSLDITAAPETNAEQNKILAAAVAAVAPDSRRAIRTIGTTLPTFTDEFESRHAQTQRRLGLEAAESAFYTHVKSSYRNAVQSQEAFLTPPAKRARPDHDEGTVVDALARLIARHIRVETGEYLGPNPVEALLINGTLSAGLFDDISAPTPVTASTSASWRRAFQERSTERLGLEWPPECLTTKPRRIRGLLIEVDQLRDKVDEFIRNGQDREMIEYVCNALADNNLGEQSEELAFFCLNKLRIQARMSLDFKRKIAMVNGAIGTIIETLTLFSEASADVTLDGCGLVWHLCMSDGDRRAVVESGGAESVLNCCRVHMENGKVSTLAMWALKALSFDTVAKEIIRGNDGMSIAFEVMNKNVSLAKVQVEGCAVLELLSVDASNEVVHTVPSHVVDAVLDSIMAHPGSIDVGEAAINCLTTFACNAENVPLIEGNGKARGALETAFKNHPRELGLPLLALLGELMQVRKDLAGARAEERRLLELRSRCSEILKSLQNHEHGWVFATPVNPVELGIDDYFDIIKKPMDLGTIGEKLDQELYHSFEDFRADVQLTFENAMKYNEEQTVVHDMAKALKKKFDLDYNKMLMSLDEDHAENSKTGVEYDDDQRRILLNTKQKCDIEGRCFFHPEIQMIRRTELLGWKVLLYSCPRCELDSALDGAGVPWVLKL